MSRRGIADDADPPSRRWNLLQRLCLCRSTPRQRSGVQRVLEGGGLEELAPAVFSVNQKELRKLFAGMTPRSCSGGSVTSWQAGRFKTVLKNAEMGLRKSNATYKVFAFGCETQHFPLEEYRALFGEEDKFQAVACSYSTTGLLLTYECFMNGRHVAQWRDEHPGGVALVLASTPEHLRLIMTAVQMHSQATLGHKNSVSESLRFFERDSLPKDTQLSLPSQFLRKSLSRSSKARSLSKSSAGDLQNSLNGRARDAPSIDVRRSSSSSITTSSAGQARPRSKSQTRSRTRSRSRSWTFSGPSLVTDPRCPAGLQQRIACGIGELRNIVPVGTESSPKTLYWRKMVLRRIILSHVPRVKQENSDWESTPFCTVMDGSQKDFLFSTMVNGMKTFKQSETDEISFKTNCAVKEDTVVKVYNIQPNQPGSILFTVHFNTAVIEPANIKDMSSGDPKETMVVLTIPRDGIDQISNPKTLPPEFCVQFVLCMSAEDRRKSLKPMVFRSEEELAYPSSRYELPSAQDVPTKSLLETLQAKCCNLLCGEMIPWKSGLTECPQCHTLMRSPCWLEKAVGESADSERQDAALSEMNTVDALEDVEVSGTPTDREDDQSDVEQEDIDDLIAGGGSFDETQVTLCLDPTDVRTEQTESERQAAPSGDRGNLGEAREGLISSIEDADSESSSNSNDSSESSEDDDDGTDSLPSRRLNIVEALGARMPYITDILPHLTPVQVEIKLAAELCECEDEEDVDLVIQEFVEQMLLSHNSISNAEEAGNTSATTTFSGMPLDEEAQRTIMESYLELPTEEDRRVFLSSFPESWGLNESEFQEHLDLFMETTSYVVRGRRGVGQSALSRFPVRTFETSSPPLKCTVCMLQVEPGNEIRTLPCFHSYHVRCIDRWLSESTKCPICMQDVASGSQQM